MRIVYSSLDEYKILVFPQPCRHGTSDVKKFWYFHFCLTFQEASILKGKNLIIEDQILSFGSITLFGASFVAQGSKQDIIKVVFLFKKWLENILPLREAHVEKEFTYLVSKYYSDIVVSSNKMASKLQ